MSNSWVRWRTKVSSSSNEPGSSSFSIRSRAVSLPFACCFSTASSEPEWTASSRSSRRYSSFSSWVTGFFSLTGAGVYGQVSTALEERAAAVLAEDVAHRVADLADRAAGAQRFLDRGQQIAVAARHVTEGLQALIELALVAPLLPLLQPRELALLRFRVDLEGVDVVDLVADVLVDADDDVLAGAVALLVGDRGLLDLLLDELERVHRSAQVLDLLHQLPGALLDLIGQGLDEVGAGEGIDGVGDARLVCEHLRGAQRDPRGALGRQRERFVEAVGVERLGTAG